MPKDVRLTVAHRDLAFVLGQVRRTPGVIGIALEPGASLQPEGDVVRISATNAAADRIIAMAAEAGLIEDGQLSVSETTTLLAGHHRSDLAAETSEVSWEEMDELLQRDTALSPNFIALMTLSGAIAGIGILQDQIHVVVAAMLVTSGFEPFVRLAIGPPIGHWRASMQGGIAVGVGYAALAVGAVAGVLLLAAFSPVDLGALRARPLVTLWSEVTWPGVLLAILGGAAGAVVIASRETVFATGVMVAVALVPSMTIAGLAVGAGDLSLALAAASRWAADAFCVTASCGLVMALKRLAVHKRPFALAARRRRR